MFYTQEQSTGTKYTQTATLLLLAFIFCPALLAISGSDGYGALATAVAGSSVLTGLALFTWRRHSTATITTITAMARRSR